MWSKEHGFIVTEEEIAINNARRLAGKNAPNLWCTKCLGLGFVHPFVDGIVSWSKAIPCECMTSDTRYNHYVNKEVENNG